MGAIVCITGTGTGVGKTLLTALLTVHLRRRGVHAWAMKPYCSGSLADARVLEGANDGELSVEDVAPVFCPQPLAPLAALGSDGAVVALREARVVVRRNRDACEVLLVEGIGGVEVPLAPGFGVGNFIAELGGRSLLVGQNRLGVINETLLSLYRLAHLTKASCPTILMETETPDLSAASNPALLEEILVGGRVARFPFLGASASAKVQESEKKSKKVLALIAGWFNLPLR